MFQCNFFSFVRKGQPEYTVAVKSVLAYVPPKRRTKIYATCTHKSHAMAERRAQLDNARDSFRRDSAGRSHGAPPCVRPWLQARVASFAHSPPFCGWSARTNPTPDRPGGAAATAAADRRGALRQCRRPAEQSLDLPLGAVFSPAERIAHSAPCRRASLA